MKRVLISVYDKTGIVDFASQLVKLSWDIISTGGTAKVLKKAGISIIPIEKITGNHEVFDGRIKTISFQIEGAILFDRDDKKHLKEAKKLRILPIDMVVCNFYPFKKVISRKKCTIMEAIENIDIGGPTMIRAAAKNYKHVIPVIDPKDYKTVLEYLRGKSGFPEGMRLQYAQKAFGITAEYDKEISRYLKNVSQKTIQNRAQKTL